MDKILKSINYLTCNNKYRVNLNNLNKINKLSKKNGLLCSQKVPKIIARGDMLKQLLNSNNKLISISQPILTKVFDDFIDKTKLMLLCDKNGYIIYMVSCLETLQWCFDRGIVLGACLDYYSFGTNAISMTLYEKRTLAILGEEHYVEALKTWYSIAAPIELNGEIIAIVSISDNAENDITQLIPLVNLISYLISEYMNNYHNEEVIAFTTNSSEGRKIDRVYFFGKLIADSNITFTIKETEILYYACLGKSTKDISRLLFISINTIKSHLRNIYQKLNVHNFNDCVTYIRNIISEKP